MQYDLNSKPQIFTNIEDATLKLLEILPTKRMQEEKWLVVAISFNAIAMAELISSKLNLYYDILFSEPIYAPNNKQNPIAMVSEIEEIVIHENLTKSFGIHKEFIYGEAHRKYEEKILKNVYKYRKGEFIVSLKEKNVLLVDEGCETALTAFTAIKTAIKAEANSVFFTVPIIPTSIEASLESSTDEIYTLYHISNFVETDFYYEDKKPVTKEDVKKILENSKHYLPLKKLKTQETKTGEKDEWNVQSK